MPQRAVLAREVEYLRSDLECLRQKVDTMILSTKRLSQLANTLDMILKSTSPTD